jgi:hypothetical protein
MAGLRLNDIEGQQVNWQKTEPHARSTVAQNVSMSSTQSSPLREPSPFNMVMRIPY